MQIVTAPTRPRTPQPPAAHRYTVADVSRMFGVPERRLRYWSQTGFVRPSERASGRLLYSFRDLIAVKVATELLGAGLPLRRVRRSLDALRASLPRVETPLARLRVRCDHDRVVVDDGEDTFDALSGQLLLDFEVSDLSEQAAEVLALPWVGSDVEIDPERNAHDWFMEGQLREAEWDGADADDKAFVEARRAYERALELDPDLAAAWTNLGSLLAEIGDVDGARDNFDEALKRDPDQPEAQANLSELALQAGDLETAIAGYRQLLRSVPDYFEAHYGLARALLGVGGRGQALAHLQRFCAAAEAIPSQERSDELQERLESTTQVVAVLKRELDGD